MVNSLNLIEKNGERRVPDCQLARLVPGDMATTTPATSIQALASTFAGDLSDAKALDF